MLNVPNRACNLYLPPVIAIIIFTTPESLHGDIPTAAPSASAIKVFVVDDIVIPPILVYNII